MSIATASASVVAGRWPEELVFDPRPADARMQLANSQRDTCRAIISAVGGLSVLGPAKGVRWRGQADIDWRIESGATRRGIIGTDLVAHETAMIASARRVGMGNAQHMGDWEILARLRHNGAATRLIDITTDPFVALFMLCDEVAQPDEMDKDGLLVAVNRDSLKEIKSPWRASAYNEMTEKTTAASLVYTTPPIDPRIAAQRGEFMLSTHPLDDSVAPLCELFSDHRPKGWTSAKLATTFGKEELSGKRGQPLKLFPALLGIRIPREVKQRLATMLQINFGFTRESIYPDWAGLAEIYKTARVPSR